ncbi:MAG: hypothetical protein ABJG86_11165 [Nitratireductor sp.]
MKHSRICNTAAIAACRATGIRVPASIDGELMALYAYMRERGFPGPETLHRKHAQIAGTPPGPYEPGVQGVFYTTFRGVAQALEPFYEEDGPDGLPQLTAYQMQQRLENSSDEVMLAGVGRRVEEAIHGLAADGRLDGWDLNVDPAAIVEHLLDRAEAAEGLLDPVSSTPDSEDQPMPDDAEKPEADSVEQRTQATQREVDAVVEANRFNGEASEKPAKTPAKKKPSAKQAQQ